MSSQPVLVSAPRIQKLIFDGKNIEFCQKELEKMASELEARLMFGRKDLGTIQHFLWCEASSKTIKDAELIAQTFERRASLRQCLRASVKTFWGAKA